MNFVRLCIFVYLSRALDAFMDAKENSDPCDKQSGGHESKRYTNLTRFTTYHEMKKKFVCIMAIHANKQNYLSGHDKKISLLFDKSFPSFPLAKS